MMRYIISLSLAGAMGFCAAVARADAPRVVTDIPVVHSLVSMVLGDLGEAELLLPPGASEHHFQLRPSQAVSIASADLVVQIGPELTPWLDNALALREGNAPVLRLLQAPDTRLRDYGAAGDAAGHDHDHDEAHDHDDEHEHGHDHSGHDQSHAGTDPHAWLDPDNARTWLALIAAELTRLDPGNAAGYTANAETGASAIAIADQTAQSLLAPITAQPFATFHDAWGYYTAHYGLNSVGSIALGDASTPGARHLSALKAQVEAGEIRCLFPETGSDPAPLERIAEATGVKIGAMLDPIGSAATPGADLYPAVLTGTAKALAECLTP